MIPPDEIFFDDAYAISIINLRRFTLKGRKCDPVIYT